MVRSLAELCAQVLGLSGMKLPGYMPFNVTTVYESAVRYSELSKIRSLNIDLKKLSDHIEYKSNTTHWIKWDIFERYPDIDKYNIVVTVGGIQDLPDYTCNIYYETRFNYLCVALREGETIQTYACNYIGWGTGYM